MSPNVRRKRNKRPPMEIEIQPVIHFLWREQYCNPDIVSELEDVYGQGVTTVRTVQRWTKTFTEERTTLNDSPKTGRTIRNNVTDVAKQIIDDDPFCSENRIAQRLTVHGDAVKRILTQEFGLRKINF
jgi:hypothetical protein